MLQDQHSVSLCGSCGFEVNPVCNTSITQRSLPISVTVGLSQDTQRTDSLYFHFHRSVRFLSVFVVSCETIKTYSCKSLMGIVVEKYPPCHIMSHRFSGNCWISFLVKNDDVVFSVVCAK